MDEETILHNGALIHKSNIDRSVYLKSNTNYLVMVFVKNGSHYLALARKQGWIDGQMWWNEMHASVRVDGASDGIKKADSLLNDFSDDSGMA